MREKEKILGFIKKLHFRLVVNHLLTYICLGGSTGFLLGLAINLLAIWFPIYGALEYSLVTALLTAAAFTAYGFYRRPGLRTAALFGDLHGFEAGLSTALEYIGQDDVFSCLQREQVCARMAGFRLPEQAPIRLPFKRGAICFTAMCLFLISALVPSPAKELAKDKQILKALVEEQKELIEEVLKEVAAEEVVSEAVKASLTELLEAALAEMDKAEGEEQLAKIMERLDKKLEKERDALADEEFAKMASQIAESLNLPSSKEEESQLASLEDTIKEELGALLEANGQGAGDSLTAEELDQLAKALAGSLHQGGLSDDQLKTLAESLSVSESQLKEALQSAQEATKGIRQNASAGTAGSNDGSMPDGNQAGGQAGMAAGSGQSGDGQGTASGTGWDTGSKQGFEKASDNSGKGEELSIPGRDLGNDENLTGLAGDGSGFITESNEGLAWQGTATDYQQVLGEYQSQAESRIRTAVVPDGVRDIVRDYFSGLNE